MRIFRAGFEPLLPQCRAVPFNDLAALERALASRDVAAFIVEPIQGKGVNLPADDYLAEAAALCRRHGTLFVADEIQTGLGRTGRFLAVEHWGVEPDMVLLAKALSGGHVPVSAVLMRKSIYDKVFDRIDRAVVHGSTFAKNDLAMAAGIATLDVMQPRAHHHAGRAARRTAAHRACFRLRERYEFVREVRGKGLMIGIEFGPPTSLKLKASWNLLETANKGLFCQLITIPLFRDHKMLTQVAGHASHTIKLLPPLIITESDCDRGRARLRRGGRRHSPGARSDLVARQDACRQCHAGARVRRELASDLGFDNVTSSTAPPPGIPRPVRVVAAVI